MKEIQTQPTVKPVTLTTFLCFLVRMDFCTSKPAVLYNDGKVCALSSLQLQMELFPGKPDPSIVRETETLDILNMWHHDC